MKILDSTGTRTAALLVVQTVASRYIEYSIVALM
jgi:hypothetical protein